MIGSGNFACAIGRIVGANCKRDPALVDEIRMWVHEETVNGRKLTEIINTDHENVKYMPGVKLPSNLVAHSDLRAAAAGADVLIFCLPHQFLDGVCEQLVGAHAPGCIAISLIKVRGRRACQAQRYLHIYPQDIWVTLYLITFLWGGRAQATIASEFSS